MTVTGNAAEDSNVDGYINKARAVRRILLGRTLSECLESGRDNILELRLFAALMVVFGHSFVLSRNSQHFEDPLHKLIPATQVHLVGVMMFFTISGFLITLSWQRRPEIFRFLRARILRLWPAITACVFLWAFAIGPLISHLPPGEYFGRGDRLGNAYAYAFGNASLFRMSWFLPGVFLDNRVPRYVNGSLWTIPVEATLYACVAVLGLARAFRFPKITSVVIAAFFCIAILWPMYSGTFYLHGIRWFGLVLCGFFGAGSIACLLREYVPISTPIWLATCAACFLARHSSHVTPLLWLCIAYTVAWLAYVPRLPSAPRGLDLSYGTYLWAFPLQQLIEQYVRVDNPYLLFAIVTPLVLVIASASWAFVEKPALSFKAERRRSSSATEPA